MMTQRMKCGLMAMFDLVNIFFDGLDLDLHS